MQLTLLHCKRPFARLFWLWFTIWRSVGPQAGISQRQFVTFLFPENILKRISPTCLSEMYFLAKLLIRSYSLIFTKLYPLSSIFLDFYGLLNISTVYFADSFFLTMYFGTLSYTKKIWPEYQLSKRNSNNLSL